MLLLIAVSSFIGFNENKENRENKKEDENKKSNKE